MTKIKLYNDGALILEKDVYMEYITEYIYHYAGNSMVI